MYYFAVSIHIQMQKTNALNLFKFLFLCFLVFTGLIIKSQVIIKDITHINKLKKSTTYVIFDDTAAETTEAYISAIKSKWKISSLEFLNRKDIRDVMKNTS